MLRTIITLLIAFSFAPLANAHHTYGSKICKQPQYTCLKVKRGENWHNLFPDPQVREVVRRINRKNNALLSGSVIAVPRDRYNVSLMSHSPFPNKIAAPGSTYIRVDLQKLAWGAYDAAGHLVKWGPASGGKNYCPDVGRACKTVQGTYTIKRKQGAGCKSSKYPKPNGGAPMPYCMHFYRGYAMHGSNTVPGFNASHGCVRIFNEDAQWLNQNFIRVGVTKVHVTR